MRINESKYYCYLRGAVIKELFADDPFLNIAMTYLEVPGKAAQLKRLSLEEKQKAVEDQIAHLQRTKTSIWYEVDAAEILAACCLEAGGKRDVTSLFGPVKQESDLLHPAALWLRDEKKLSPLAEISVGTKRIDVLGYRKGGFFSSDLVVAIELKNEIKQFERALDQMSTYTDYAHHVYLGCTAHMAAEYVAKHANSRTVRHWDPHVLNSKLQKFGFGLLLIRYDGPQRVVVEELIAPRPNAPNKKKLAELLAAMENRPSVL